ncbi:MAG: phospho-N-acetylmuramoyl-pentapeptide-transferase [bacterium]
MFYHLIYQWHTHLSFLNVFHYISVRAAFAAITAFFLTIVIGKWMIERLKHFKATQVVRRDGPEKHLVKEGTPTMGGLIMIVVFGITMLLWGRFDNPYVYIVYASVLWYGGVGFFDDFMKLRVGSKGISALQKLTLQIVGAFGIVLAYVYYTNLEFRCLTCISVPFVKNPLVLPLWLFAIVAAIVIAGWSNAVNLTDGLDGLAAGLSMFVFATFTVLAYVIGNYKLTSYLFLLYVPQASELTVICSAFFGVMLGFLWFNSYPATVFMGDVGSLMLGGTIGTISVLLKQEILLFIVGLVFIIELFSVIIQVTSYKMTKKRVFMMAPLHHHFELKGVSEPKIIVRFWILAIIILMFTLSTLKLR